MIHLVLDTSIYCRDLGRRKAAFKALLKLGANNDIKLHIPYVVEREFKSHRLEEYGKYLNVIDDAVSNLRNKHLPKDLEKSLLKQEISFQEFQTKTMLWIDKEFAEWVDKIKANKCKLLPNHSERVFDSYFEGLPPFAKKKARSDIPDSFIFETVKDLSNKFKELIFVVGDDRFKKASDGIANLRTYVSLEDFIESSECQKLLLEHDVEEYKNAISLQIKDSIEIFEKAVDDLFLDAIIGKKLGDRSIPDDNEEATINSVDKAENICIECDCIEYYGDGLFVVPFSLNTEVYADYYIFKSDYYCMDDEKALALSISDWNDHYFAVEEDFYVHVSGLLSFRIDVSKLKEQFKIREILEMDSFEIDSIEDIKLVIAVLISQRPTDIVMKTLV